MMYLRSFDSVLVGVLLAKVVLLDGSSDSLSFEAPAYYKRGVHDPGTRSSQM